MPLIDKPLDELKTYLGRNPRPADHTEFWDKSLAEMRALDPRVELKPAAFQAPYAECFDLTFTGVGGARIYAKYLRPAKQQGRAPAIVQFHGYSGNSGDWHDKLAWVASGFHFASLDVRGQAGRSQDIGGVIGNTLNGHIIRGLAEAENGHPEKLLFHQIFLDTAQLAGLVMAMPEVDPGRVGAMGGSQGGGLTLACASLEPRIARLAPSVPFLCDYKRVWEMDLAKDAYAELKNYFRHFDPRHEREERIFEALGYIDAQHLAERIRGETLMLTGLMDATCPPSTQFAAYNRITAPKNMLIYPDFGHEGLPQAGDRAYEFMLGLR